MSGYEREGIMSEVFGCDDKETLVAYMYGEVDADVRREVERHLRTCVACAHEYGGLQAVRRDLQSWVPPEPALDVMVVPQENGPRAVPPPVVRRRGAWARELPVWAQVAAATLFVGVAAGLANIEVRSDSNGFVVTTGWLRPAAPTEPLSTASAPGTTLPVADTADAKPWQRDLAALDESLRNEIAAQLVTSRGSRGSDTVDAAALLRRVEAMIAASEERQRQELAVKLLQAERVWNVRRQTDLVNINRTFGTLQNRQMAVQVNQQEMLNQLRRVSFTQPPQ